jgi:Lon protease-like protein
MLGSDDAIWRRPIPLFPLPNCVLFPGAVLPLHIFEPRYIEMLQMIAARSPAERLLAMALLRDGWEQHYHSKRAPIHPVLCVGRVIQHEELDEGQFNLLLLGLRRATIITETGDRLFRQALLSPIESNVPEFDDRRLRELLHRAVSAVSRHTGALSKSTIDQIFDSAPDADILVDVLAYHLIPGERIDFKQSLLEERHVPARAGKLMRHLREALAEADRHPEIEWPPPTHLN